MLSFHNDPKIKKKYLARVLAHQKADEIFKRVYVDNEKRKYCAVGCTIHSSFHKKYENELGIPMILARLEDRIFENLPDDRAKIWPYEFLNCIHIGVDLSNIWPKFACWLLTDKKHGVIQYANTKKQKEIIRLISDYYKNPEKITKEQWNTAAATAYVTYAAAASVYAAAAYYATADRAAAAAGAAADSAAAAHDTAPVAKKSNIRIAQADKLLKLLKEAK